MSPPIGTFIVGNKLMAVCRDCGKVVRVDKPIIGSLHVCTLEAAQRQDREIARREALRDRH